MAGSDPVHQGGVTASLLTVLSCLVVPQSEPVEAVAPEGQQVGQVADGREAHPAEQLDRVPWLEEGSSV